MKPRLKSACALRWLLASLYIWQEMGRDSHVCIHETGQVETDSRKVPLNTRRSNTHLGGAAPVAAHALAVPAAQRGAGTPRQALAQNAQQQPTGLARATALDVPLRGQTISGPKQPPSTLPAHPPVGIADGQQGRVVALLGRPLVQQQRNRACLGACRPRGDSQPRLCQW